MKRRTTTRIRQEEKGGEGDKPPTPRPFTRRRCSARGGERMRSQDDSCLQMLASPIPKMTRAWAPWGHGLEHVYAVPTQGPKGWCWKSQA